MRLLDTTLKLLLLLYIAFATPGWSQVDSLKLLLIDANTGKPVANHVLVFYGDSPSPDQIKSKVVELNTDQQGFAPLAGPAVHARYFQVFVDWHRTCVANPNADAIDVRAVPTRGITVNHCSNRAFSPTPGVLTIAAREETFFEKMSH